ncbi:unnamed protein product, partial [Effrenium voratum]
SAGCVGSYTPFYRSMRRSSAPAVREKQMLQLLCLFCAGVPTDIACSLVDSENKKKAGFYDQVRHVYACCADVTAFDLMQKQESKTFKAALLDVSAKSSGSKDAPLQKKRTKLHVTKKTVHAGRVFVIRDRNDRTKVFDVKKDCYVGADSGHAIQAVCKTPGLASSSAKHSAEVSTPLVTLHKRNLTK